LGEAGRNQRLATSASIHATPSSADQLRNR
jgi:hypothetical protein